ncbi:hypothetical protein HAX54_053248 [Datura stramonium]|uniref:Uncharacterized protein n=1 Tax=Datura stramonium TaxID=4076 RepID=A0ABS8WS08_DATST|nr:hypothetical protein [Datura stramonium]
MHMAERQWAEAATDFFEAFKNYDEAGNQRRIQCLALCSSSWCLISVEVLFLVLHFSPGELNVPEKDAEELLVHSSWTTVSNGHIDQVNRLECEIGETLNLSSDNLSFSLSLCSELFMLLHADS